jgi:hypothetical protein
MLRPKRLAAELDVNVSLIYRAVRHGHPQAFRLGENGGLRIPRPAQSKTSSAWASVLASTSFALPESAHARPGPSP